jgi:hypothetical protein
VDVCQDEACVGGAEVDCAELDDACNVGVCDRETGECVTVEVLPGTPCEDGDPCTLSEACNAGRCVGTPRDCTELDTVCGVGVCDEGGECALEPVEDGTSCSNGDACVLGEQCSDGACGGGADQCFACIEARPGDGCDDGNPCTQNDTCTAGLGRVRCTGEAVDCSGFDGNCLVGRCDPQEGGCFSDASPNGATCDDGDACTTGDVCSEGSCSGLDFPVCGEEQAQFCEPFTPIDSIEFSQPVDFFEGDELLIRGRVEVPGENDWYVLSLVKGQFISIETGPDCDSELDTFISLRMSDGETVLAFNDDAVGFWSRLEDIEIPETGLYFVQVTSYEDENALSSYLLRLTQRFPPPCESDLDCGCDLLVCARGREIDEQAGVCIGRSPEEAEPNNASETGGQVNIGDEIMGDLSHPSDEDWFALELEAERPVDILSLPFCEGPTDTLLRLYDTDGRTELLHNDDFEGGVMAGFRDFLPPRDGTYFVQVIGHNFATGAYRMVVEGGGCQFDIDCGCEDLFCVGEFNRGVCMPQDPEAEPNDSLETAMQIDIDERVSGRISSPREADNFVVFLPPGSYRARTSGLCGGEGDTSLRMKDEQGNVLAADEDSGEGRFAMLEEITIEQAGFFFFEVTYFGLSQGDYVLQVSGQ